MADMNKDSGRAAPDQEPKTNHLRAIPDHDLLVMLRDAVDTAVPKNDGRLYMHTGLDNWGVMEKLTEIHRRATTNGLDAHPSFKPLFNILSKLQVKDSYDFLSIARALRDNDFCPENPFKAALEGRKGSFPKPFGS